MIYTQTYLPLIAVKPEHGYRDIIFIYTNYCCSLPLVFTVDNLHEIPAFKIPHQHRLFYWEVVGIAFDVLRLKDYLLSVIVEVHDCPVGSLELPFFHINFIPDSNMLPNILFEETSSCFSVVLRWAGVISYSILIVDVEKLLSFFNSWPHIAGIQLL